MFTITEAWKAAYLDAHAGILVMREVHNPPAHPELENRKKELETQLRAQYSGQDRKAIEASAIIAAYNAYYKRFKKTFPVQAQLESILFKDRSIPSVAALVEAMFMAEVKNLLLTAGHDLDKLQLPVTLNVANGNEQYTLLRAQEQTLKSGDMFMSDQAGVISSIIYGPDQRTQITAATSNVLFAVYTPSGISSDTVQAHLQDIRDYVLVVSPGARVEALQVSGGE
jgi:DNA/RNA-binding domain of Phe-tRNA-synthetase-like protein